MADAAANTPHRELAVDRGRLSRGELRSAERIASDVFTRDGLFQFLFPNAERRTFGVGRLHRGLLTVAPKVAMVSTSAHHGVLTGVSMWVPPGNYPYPPRVEVRTGFQALTLSWRAGMALGPGGTFMRKVVAEHLRSPHYYLQLLMVDRDAQGTGLGTLLMQPGLDRADHDGLPCYLETQRHDNLAFYARFGFTVTATIGGTNGEPTMWAMTRLPRSS